MFKCARLFCLDPDVVEDWPMSKVVEMLQLAEVEHKHSQGGFTRSRE